MARLVVVLYPGSGHIAGVGAVPPYAPALRHCTQSAESSDVSPGFVPLSSQRRIPSASDSACTAGSSARSHPIQSPNAVSCSFGRGCSTARTQVPSSLTHRETVAEPSPSAATPHQHGALSQPWAPSLTHIDVDSPVIIKSGRPHDSLSQAWPPGLSWAPAAVTDSSNSSSICAATSRAINSDRILRRKLMALSSAVQPESLLRGVCRQLDPLL